MDEDERTLIVLTSVVFLIMVGISAIIPVLPLYGLYFGASQFMIGLLVGSLAAARVLMDLPSGMLGDTLGNRRMMQVGLIVIAVSSTQATISFDYWMLLAARVLEGVGSALYVTSSLAILSRSAPAGRRGRYMSYYVGGLLIGQTIGPVVGGAVASSWGLRAPFALYAIIAIVSMILIAFFLRTPDWEKNEGGTSMWKETKQLLSDRSFIIVNLGTMSAFFVRGGLIGAVLPLFIYFNMGIQDESVIGLLISVQAIASMVTLLPSGRLADVHGRRIPFVTSLVATGLITPLIYFAKDLYSQMLVMALYGVTLGLHGPLAAWAADLAPRDSMGTAMGLYRTVSDLGFLLGPLILAGVAEATSDDIISIWPFILTSIWMLASGLLLLLARDPAAGGKMRHVPPEAMQSARLKR